MIVKFGDKSEAFVRKALEIATQNQRLLPQAFDLDEMRRDTQLFDGESLLQVEETLIRSPLNDR